MTDYERFKIIYDEIDELIEKRVASTDKDFITWHTKADRFLRKKYGDGPEFKDFAGTHFSLLVFFDAAEDDYIEVCREGLETTK